MAIDELPSFVRASWPFTCSECLEEMPEGSPMMVYREELAPRRCGVGVRPATRRFCEDCGKLLIESLTWGESNNGEG